MVESFLPGHLQQIELQSAQAYWQAHGSEEYAQMLARGLAYTLRIDGRLIACAGVIEISPTQGHLWSFLSVHAPRHMVRLHKIARRFLEVSGKRQLVATTEIDFPDGSRWLEMLGFLKVGCLDHYGPDGRDHHLYILER